MCQCGGICVCVTSNQGEEKSGELGHVTSRALAATAHCELHLASCWLAV